MKVSSPYQSIVLMGKTGCGKGTQAALLSEALGYRVFSTGEEVRRIGREDTPFGRRISAIQVTGWVPEWLASYLMTKAMIESVDEGLVFESVARKPAEAKKLHEIHTMLERNYLVVQLEVSDKVAIERMMKRGRGDYDQADNMKSRLAAYEAETLESLNFFEGEGKLRKVNADQTPEQVFKDIINLLQK